MSSINTDKTRRTRERFTHALVHLARRWRWSLDRRLHRTGLTQARWSALLQISRGGDGLAQRHLAQHIGIEGPTLVPLLDSLSASGLVERRPDPVDRRSKTVHLTPAAGPVLNEIEVIADGLRLELTDGIPARDLETCIRVFGHILERIASEAERSQPT